MCTVSSWITNPISLENLVVAVDGLPQEQSWKSGVVLITCCKVRKIKREQE